MAALRSGGRTWTHRRQKEVSRPGQISCRDEVTGDAGAAWWSFAQATDQPVLEDRSPWEMRRKN